ncbi:DNA-binding protein [Paludibacter sp. 221]|uniref:helix-turn-helix transcriptional regulator n=1 Tax=Paludibacter sp. 221 TaxID=2302939 RepID=UPI0013D07846|nr:helix-turn-helix domain-containing protein [Paludibacter sp. 221]NDV46868.1 DNA-binding protein [Paludibacter sp. 221]
MKQRTIEELKGKPLFTLSVDEFISLQETIRNESLSSTIQFPEIMSIDMAAQFTGYKKSTLYRKTSDHTIPFFRQGARGGRVLFRKSELEEWLLSNKQETVKEHIERLEAELKNKGRRKIS